MIRSIVTFVLYVVVKQGKVESVYAANCKLVICIVMLRQCREDRALLSDMEYAMEDAQAMVRT